MITVRPFTMSVLDKAKQFFALRTINSDSLEIFRRTPAGDDPFTEADVWRMDNGQLVVSLNHPFYHLRNLVLIAKSEGVEEIINLEHFDGNATVTLTFPNHKNILLFLFASSFKFWSTQVF